MSELNHAFVFCKSKGMLVNSTTENPFDSQKYSLPAVTTQQKYASKVVNGEEVQWHELIDEKELEDDRRAFTKVERDVIIRSFYESNRSTERRLAPLIEFLFLTGCRPSESLPLTWRDIDFDRNLIRFSKSLGQSTKKVKETKTGETRLFYFSNSSRLKELLLKLRNESLGDLIFPNKKGKHCKAEDITRSWATQKQVRRNPDGTEFNYYHTGVVTQLSEQGAISGYLSPYHTRHTYITLMAHANKQDNNALLYIATSCGNSVDVILRHYLGASENTELIQP